MLDHQQGSESVEAPPVLQALLMVDGIIKGPAKINLRTIRQALEENGGDVVRVDWNRAVTQKGLGGLFNAMNDFLEPRGREGIERQGQEALVATHELLNQIFRLRMGWAPEANSSSALVGDGRLPEEYYPENPDQWTSEGQTLQ